MRSHGRLQSYLCGLMHSSTSVINLLVAEVRSGYNSREKALYEMRCVASSALAPMHLQQKTDSILSFFHTHIPHPQCTQTRHTETHKWTHSNIGWQHHIRALPIVHVHTYATVELLGHWVYVKLINHFGQMWSEWPAFGCTRAIVECHDLTKTLRSTNYNIDSQAILYIYFLLSGKMGWADGTWNI